MLNGRSLYSAFVLLMMLSAGRPAAVRAAASDAGRKRVLLLYSDHDRLPVSQAQDAAFRDSFRRGGVPIDIFSESLDYSRLGDGPPDGEDGAIAAYLGAKYSRVAFDAIITIKPAALGFALRHRDLFGHAPIVFCNVGREEPLLRALPADVVGTVTDYGVFVTSTVMRRMQPDLAHVAIIVGASEREAAFLKLSRDVVARIHNGVTVEYWVGRTLDELTGGIARLPARSAVLFISQFRDSKGQYYVPQEVLAEIAAGSSVPIYSIASTYLGTGTVGGTVFDAKADSEAAASLALRILRGTKAADLTPVTSPPVNMFDARALRRYGLSEARVPAGSTILFREPSVWARYRQPMLWLAAFFVLETCLVIGLLLQVKARRRSEDALRRSGEQVQDLVGRLIAAQEEERRRLAVDLHDDMSQELALLSIDLEQIGQGIAAAGAPLVPRTSAALSRVAEIASSVRDLSHQLHPAKLELLGLTRATEALCREVASKHRIEIDFRADLLPSPIAPETALCLYRVVQEALHNVAKHSGARRAEVSLTAKDDCLLLHVADSGAGFDAGARLSQGLGLVSMRERVHFLGGRFVIHAEPGMGTRLGVQVPIRAAAKREQAPGDSRRASA